MDQLDHGPIRHEGGAGREKRVPPRAMGFAPRPLAPPRPAVLAVLVLLVATAELGLYFPQRGELGFLVSLYASIVWSLPIGITALIAWGAYLASRNMRRETNGSDLTPVDELVIVQIPTIGRHDVIPALTRVVESMEREMPAHYPHWRVDVVAEQTSPAKADLEALASENVRVLYVPSVYRTPNGTERKARANQWMNDLRVAEAEARADVWVLHMDDDTGVGPDTPPAIARVIHDNPPGFRNSADLAQGVLTYPRQYVSRFWPWLADAIRPGSDLSLFYLSTDSGSPFIGAHGELLLVRASTEAEIGWDFGRNLSITEDANFALIFGGMSTRRSTWFPARCYGSSPERIRDLVAQRQRWARGLLHVAGNRELPRRARLILLYAMLAWFMGPFQHVVTVVAVAILVGNPNTSPLSRELLLLWAFNMSVVLWMYVEGLRANVHASGFRGVPRKYWLALLAIPWLTLVEGWAAVNGMVDFAKDRLGLHRGELFHVIAKTHDGSGTEKVPT
jgi:beta-1,4-mannosyltransferase